MMMNKVVLAIPALQRDTHWDDLGLLLHSIRIYAPGYPVVVGWKGETAPPTEPSIHLFRQSPEAKHFGDACRELIEMTATEDVLFLNDDCVVTPGMMEALEEDLGTITQEAGVERVGLVGLRSNFVAGVQNVRRPQGIPGQPPRFANGIRWESEDYVLATDSVFGVAFYAPRVALDEAGLDWTRVHWWGDTLLSWDLAKKGFLHFVSRGYVHHHGSRSGGQEKWAQWDAEARAWISEHRPDAARAWGWSGTTP